MTPRSSVRSLRATALFCTAVSAAACEQTSQTLPFETGTEPASRTIPAEGGVLSTAAGASFRFPSGALPGGATVSLATVAVPAGLASGAPASGLAFVLDGGGAALAAPVGAELKIAAPEPRGWLAAAVVHTPDGVREIGDASGDLAVGILRTRIPTFGTVIAVFPEAAAVTAVRRIHAGASASLAPAAAVSGIPATGRLRGNCGGAGQRCSGLEVAVSENLLAYADTSAVVFAEVGGELAYSGGSANGSLHLRAPLRLRLKSGDNFVTVPVRVSVTPTAATTVTETPGTIRLVGVRLRVESPEGTTEEVATLTVTYEGTAARLTVHRRIGATLGSVQETAEFLAVVPLVRLP